MNCCCLRHCHCLSMKSVEFAVSKAIRRDVLCVWKEDNEFKDEFRRKKAIFITDLCKGLLNAGAVDNWLPFWATRLFSDAHFFSWVDFDFSSIWKIFTLPKVLQSFLKSKFLGLLYMGTRWNKLHDLKYSQYASHL